MKTQEIEELTGLSKDTLRYYEAIGLLRPDRTNYARNYQEKDVERINHILILKALDFTLQEIQILVAFDDAYTSQEAINRMPVGDQAQLLELMSSKLHHLKEKSQHIQKGIEMLAIMKEKVEALSNGEEKELID